MPHTEYGVLIEVLAKLCAQNGALRVLRHKTFLPRSLFLPLVILADEFGNPRPVAFMQYRVNGQYIMEGLASSFLFSLGGSGFIILDRSNAVGLTKLNRTMLFSFGFFCIIAAFLAVRVFMTMKLP